MYLTYSEYQEMGGALEETAFRNLEFDAESTVNWYTFNRLKKPEWASVLETEELKRCVYQLLRIKQAEEELLAGSMSGLVFTSGNKVSAGIVEQDNDGVKTKYNVASSKDMLEYLDGAKTKQDIVQRYLGSVLNELGQSILYRGIYPGE